MASYPGNTRNLKPGNKRGPSKTTALLKDAILAAADQAGGTGGMVAYLQRQAIEQPAAFMGLLGKVLPLQVTGDPNAPLQMMLVTGVPRTGD